MRTYLIWNMRITWSSGCNRKEGCLLVVVVHVQGLIITHSNQQQVLHQPGHVCYGWLHSESKYWISWAYFSWKQDTKLNCLHVVSIGYASHNQEQKYRQHKFPVECNFQEWSVSSSGQIFSGRHLILTGNWSEIKLWMSTGRVLLVIGSKIGCVKKGNTGRTLYIL